MSAPDPDVVLVTASEMPKPDEESALIIAALAARGASAGIRAWDDDVDWLRIPLVVCRSPWDYYYRVEAFLAWADMVASATRLENPAPVLRWNAHKSYLIDLADAGVPVVPTTLVPKGAGEETLHSALADRDDVVMKPAVSVGAIGALMAKASDPAAGDHLRRLAAEGDVLVQPFVSTIQHEGESSLLFFDGRPSHAVRKLPAAGDYRVQDHHGGTVRSHTATEAELAVADAALAAAPGDTTYARIDLVATSDGPCVMELELIEPELFLRFDEGAADRYARCLTERL